MALVGERELSLVEDMLSEINVYLSYKKRLSDEIMKLELDYQEEKFGYVAFKERLDRLLKDRSEEDWYKYYDAYIYSLVKRIDKILAELFYQVYSDKRVPLVEEDKPIAQNLAIQEESLHAPPLAHPDSGSRALNIKFPRYEDVKREIVEAEKEHMLRLAEAKSRRVKKAVEEIPQQPAPLKAAAPEKKRFSVMRALTVLIKDIKAALARIPKPHIPKIRLPERKPKIAVEKKPVLKPRGSIFSKFPSISALFRKTPKPAKEEPEALVFKKGKSPFIDEVMEMEKGLKPVEKAPLKSSGGIVFGWFSAQHLWDEIVGKFGKKQEPVMSEETEVPEQMKKLREVRKRLYEDEKVSRFDSTLLAQEAQRVRRILEVEKPSVYKGNSLGLIANVTVKKISLFLVDKFPEMFGVLYNALRAANIKVLSNTYVNIMILIAIAMMLFLGTILTFFFFAMNYELYQIILRSAIISLTAGAACIAIFYAYPFFRIKERRKSITTNLPFAINHISSVAASGVPPAKMFELISRSSEYGEVAVEIRKIVDFITIFGYDFLTAVKAVASTTPSPAFKEFLEGMVSTIETGGDLDSFLKQKSEETTLTYQLERQRYNESVSTYSDIYTGLLIAAPLFFIASLTMVNLLGGTIGGMGVNTLMAVCAYLAIPLLN
ncbi:MAG: type II secretion system F family protein, partial [Candidatus Woesearchaeota archaeon]